MILRILRWFRAFRELEERLEVEERASREASELARRYEWKSDERLLEINTLQQKLMEQRSAIASLEGRLAQRGERIERQIDELAGMSEQLDDARERETFWQDKATHWESEYRGANAEAIKARETVADFLAQLRFGRKIFEHAPALPDKPPSDKVPITRERVQARVQVQRAEARFNDELAEYVKKRADHPQAAAPVEAAQTLDEKIDAA